MEYKIIKVFNNNVVLAKEKKDEVILVSKGIGFGKKIGDFIKANANIEKVFHQHGPNDKKLKEINEMSLKIKKLTHQIIEIAQENLGVLNENSEKMLEEHIEFAIERLRMGLTIENPFIEEIIILYRKEYEIAGIAREHILNEIGIDIGEEEQGFITLHLCSARKNKPLTEIMKITRIYKECLQIIEQELKTPIRLDSSFNKEFFRLLKFYVDTMHNYTSLEFEMKEDVRKRLGTSFKIATKIAQHIEEEMHISFTPDIIAYMTVDMHKLMQMK